MKKLLNLLAVLALVVVISSCNDKKTEEAPTTETEQTEVKDTKVYSIRDIYNSTGELEDQTITVSGKIEHICRHSKKRLKIIDPNGKFEMKVELGEDMPPVDTTVVMSGKYILVKGTLLPNRMNLEEVKKWKEMVKEHHAGMEEEDHYKEEIAYLDGIIARLEAGEIENYVLYGFAAVEYTIQDEPVK